MSTKEFHISTTNELLAIKDRVRNLINHWGEDGRYKEAILKSVISRFLPSSFNIATGFVVKQSENRDEHLSSRQIDLLIYDSSQPVLFKDSDFVIVTPDAVRAIIEVKANMNNQGVSNVVRRANENGKFIFSGKTNINSLFFNGVFSFDGLARLNSINQIQPRLNAANDGLQEAENSRLFKVNHIAFNKDKFYKYWPNNIPGQQNKLYTINNLAFSFFISNLMDFLRDVDHSYLWFPVDKEQNIIGTF
ncbi:MAG TPA: DUF6602 domain-containing protein [Flavisolibacter sp.]|jgi:hypothetical protein|nr:DUF6602 domain-containing protein [Flavisolibacter sp.]